MPGEPTRAASGLRLSPRLHPTRWGTASTPAGQNDLAPELTRSGVGPRSFRRSSHEAQGTEPPGVLDTGEGVGGALLSGTRKICKVQKPSFNLRVTLGRQR